MDGTKEEMERLLEDASKISGIKYDISSFADVTKAIHVMQESMGIAGTTAKEASTTIEGSLNSVKGAWENLLVGITNPDADWDKLIQDLVDTVTTAGENILPAVQSALVGVSALIRDLFPTIAQEIPGLVGQILPQLIETGISVVNSLIIGIQQNMPALITCAMQIVTNLANGIVTMLPQILSIAIQLIQALLNGIITMLPQIIQMGVQLIIQLINGITQMIPQLIPIAINAIITIVNGLLDNIGELIDAGIQLIIALAEGLLNAIPQLVDKIPYIIERLLQAILSNLPKIIAMGIRLLIELGAGLIAAIPQLVAMIPQIIQAIINAFFSTDWGAVGVQLIQGLVNGFSNAGNIIWEAIKRVGNSMIDGIKSFFGIHSPSKLFADLGQYLPQGFAVGIDKDSKKAIKSIDKMNKDILNEVDLDDVLLEMKNTVDFEAQNTSANLSATATNDKMLYANIMLKSSDIYLDSTKVGRAVTPVVSKTLRGAGAY